MKGEKVSVEVHNLSVTYSQLPVLWDIDFALPSAELIGIIGPNGSGKSTLLKAILGLVKLSSGKVYINGSEARHQTQSIAYVPQRETVDWNFPVSVREVVEMGRYRPSNLWKRLSKLDHQIVEEAMQRVGIADLANRQIGQLSGGQQQRVFIARALAQKASIYLLDEPFVGVDVATEGAILQLFQEMKFEGKTIVVVHHDLQAVSKYFDTLVLLNTRLIAMGRADEVLTKENLKATYGGQLNVFAAVQQELKKRNFPLREKGMEEF